MQLVSEIRNNQQDPNIQAEHHVHDSSSLIKINADITENQRTVAIWCSFFIIVGLLYVLTFTVPDTFATIYDNNLIYDCSHLKNNPSFQKDPYLRFICYQFNTQDNRNFGGIVSGMSRMNQFLIVRLVLKKQPYDVQNDIQMYGKFTGHFYELNDDYTIDSRTDTKKGHQFTANCPSGSVFCDEITLIYHSKIDHSNYAFVVHFDSDFQWDLSPQIAFQHEYVNSDYTSFLLALRYTCVIVSIIMTIAYVRKLQRISYFHWVIEQRLIVLLSGLLILFNNPFYATTILIPNMASAFFDVFFLVNFFVCLLVFFLVILDRVINENGQKLSKALDKKKIIFAFVIYIFLLLTYIGFSYNHLDDPYTSFQDSFGGFYDFCKWTGVVILVAYFLYIIYLYYWVFKSYNTLIWRNRLFSLFSMYYIVCCALFAFSGSMDIYGSVGGRALLFITILNLYVYYLHYMYSFSPQGYQEAQQIINLEVGNKPQIYEVLDDSLHGIDIASQQGDHQNIQKQNINNQEQMLAQDIFQQHQQFNTKKNGQEQEMQNYASNKTPEKAHNFEQEFANNSNEHQSQQIKAETGQHKNSKSNEKYHKQNEEGESQAENGDLVLNFDKDEEEEEY
ncbi:Wnt secretion Wnt-binding factor (macronuclear) [Tetrahymena thermophila SB210]|uniref:Wnt secretion Wnt-binding factor n=1 Tax=Tetrahymena thermophila (strain SB210) TaxID=312017 RepID=Q246A1_TETTS|nr:Wnt secretion Wnt-binding factor [Tetrahymena thermophila SB210]EAS03482.3 Wnt secretion Wnt-binding factor [Tetrahymena thermophila SB210]|eukprot:XP_001023727.3 Wnt secretion Wnt-binding factor [Tetrahymena thermophila SB210]